jgi:hypothetical protein
MQGERECGVLIDVVVGLKYVCVNCSGKLCVNNSFAFCLSDAVL